jgi:hypothetical protein
MDTGVFAISRMAKPSFQMGYEAKVRVRDSLLVVEFGVNKEHILIFPSVHWAQFMPPEPDT